jgi:hypothetical protein
MLTARENGSKCMPYVLLPRKRADANIVKKFHNKLCLSWVGKVWMDDELTVDFLQRILGHTFFANQHRLLVWDAFRCHISATTKAQLKRQNIDVAVVPGGCTKFVQAPDVCWNAPFKAKIRQYYENWLLNGEKSFTSGGNMRAPSMEVYLEWIYSAWDSLPKEMILESFKVCGISNATDGKEDGKIHCFKPEGPCPGGRTLLATRNANLVGSARSETVVANAEPAEEEEEIDITQDEENGYASDASMDL